MVKLIRWKVKPTGIDLDKQFVGDVVDLVIPAGTTVQYRVQDVGLQFRTTCNIPVSIDDLVNLPKHDCVKISRSLPIADNQPIVRSGRLLISMAILILGIPACMLAVRWFRKSVVVSSLVVLSSAIFGCDKVEDVDHGRSIVVQPSGFDFRSISSEQTFLSDELIVSNMGVDPKRFNLSASCGCTVLEVDEFLVDPGETVRVPFTLQIQGRKGLFTSIIRLIEFRGKTFEVPVRAFFTQDIFANPSRVLLSDSGEQSLTGSVLIVDSTRPETDIEVRGSNPAIQVTIVRGEDGAGEYLVSVPFHSLEGTDNAIQVYYSGQVNPVMTIPIIGDPSLLLKKNQN